MNSYFRLGLRDANLKLRSGALSCVDYVQSLLERTRALENDIGAWVWLDFERARDCAKTLATNNQLKTKPLYGIPIGIKDVIDVAGIPTCMGSEIFRENIPCRSAPIIDRLLQTGGFVLGKTVTAEFAFLAPGKTTNPWNSAYTPGGSSSGSAAAVAAGFVPVAIGTQTNGSVIRPAAYCGIVGYKPSQGTISNEGSLDYSPHLDQIGIFTRNVADAAWFASTIIPVNWEFQTLNSPGRLAAVRSPVWHLTQAEQKSQFVKDIEIFRAAGTRVIETELPKEFNDAHQVHRQIMSYETARYFADLQVSHHDQISEILNCFIGEGNKISHADYRFSIQKQNELKHQMKKFLSEFDAIITPPATGEAPKTLVHTGDPSFCTIWTLCGVPAISIPTGLGPNGLPLGLQLISGTDNQLLEVAAWCEKLVAFEDMDMRI